MFSSSTFSHIFLSNYIIWNTASFQLHRCFIRLSAPVAFLPQNPDFPRRISKLSCPPRRHQRTIPRHLQTSICSFSSRILEIMAPLTFFLHVYPSYRHVRIHQTSLGCVRSQSLRSPVQMI